MLIPSLETAQPTQIAILGRGLETVEDQIRLSDSSRERVVHVAGYYREHQDDIFTEEGARIVCSGGSPLLSKGEFGSVTEGGLSAELLEEEGVPPRLIHVEKESLTTWQNLAFSARYLNLGALTMERPLGLGAHAGHLKRAVDGAHKLYGSETPVVGLIAPGEDDLRRELQEGAMRLLWRGVMLGVPEFDKDTLLAREQRVAKIVGKASGIIRGLIK